MAPKRSSESQLQGDIKCQRTYELEASEEKKNVQAATEFWAVMRATHGFQNQAEGLKVQAAAVTEVARAREPGSCSKQQVEAHLESQKNPKRRRRSDDEYKNPTNHSLDTITVTTKSTKSDTENPPVNTQNQSQWP